MNKLTDNNTNLPMTISGVVLSLLIILLQIVVTRNLSLGIFNQYQNLLAALQILIGFTGFALIWKFILKGDTNQIGLRPFSAKKAFLWIVIGLILFILGNMVTSILEPLASKVGLGISDNLLGIEGVMFKSTILSAVAFGILIPLWEEFVFRGVIYNGLSKYPIIGALVSSALFALSHFGALLNYFVTGLVFLYIYRKSGSLWVAIITHIIIDIVGLTLMSL